MKVVTTSYVASTIVGTRLTGNIVLPSVRMVFSHSSVLRSTGVFLMNTIGCKTTGTGQTSISRASIWQATIDRAEKSSKSLLIVNDGMIVGR